MKNSLIKKDTASFTTAILAIKDQSYRIAYSYLNNEQDSVDAVYNAVEKALNNIKKLKNPDFFSTWFIRIVINECKMLLRIKSKTITLSDKESYAPSDIVENLNDESIDLEIILKELDPTDRSLIYMKYYIGYTLEEIADIIKLPIGTVKTKIYNNLKLLRHRLEIKER